MERPVNPAVIDLRDGYYARPLAAHEYELAFKQLESQVFGTAVYDWRDDPKVPLAGGLKFYYGIYYTAESGKSEPGNSEPGSPELVGWHYARQTDERTVNMSVTGFLPAHRGKGLYTRLLKPLLEVFREAGFMLVSSQHHLTNNAVIVPKLRAGFVAQGIDLTRAGVMLQLLYSFDATYREYLDVRCGLARPGPEVAARLGLGLELGLPAREG